MASNNAIEKKAINAVEAALLQCPYLDPCLDKDSTMPSWDGNIFVYRSKEFEKANQLGKVPVQVKGSKKSNALGNSIHFSIEVADLRNYYSDGGVVFFVVYFESKSNSRKIYYASLLPFDLNTILKDIGKQKYKTISLGVLPESDSNELANIFMAFLSDRPKQMSIINKEVPTIERLESLGFIESFSFGITGVGIDKKAPEKYVTTHELYLYAKPKGLDIEIPVQKMRATVMTREICAPVSVDGKTYYSEYSVEYREGEAYVIIGKSLTLTTTTSNYQFSYALNGHLSERIRDAEFMLALLNAKSITINNRTLQFNNINESNIREVAFAVEHLRRVKIMLDQLGVKEDLACDQLTEKDKYTIHRLIDTVLFHNNISIDNMADPVLFGSMNIANLSILVWAQRHEDGLYSIESFFNMHPIVFSYDDESKVEHIPTSQFLLLNKENFIHSSNMDYQKVYDSLSQAQRVELFWGSTTQLLLEMLKAYDAMQEKEPGLLTLAERVCELIAENENSEEVPIMLLNRLQIIKRKRVLSLEEIAQLMSLKNTSDTDKIQCAANILLEKFDDAHKCFERLPEEERRAFMEYPIYSLWRS